MHLRPMVRVSEVYVVAERSQLPHRGGENAYRLHGNPGRGAEKSPRCRRPERWNVAQLWHSVETSSQPNAVFATSGPISWRPVRILETGTVLHSGRRNEAFLHESSSR